MSDEHQRRTEQERTFDRPIDRYPRIRDGGWWIIKNGVLQFLIGFWAVSRAWRGIDPGWSALLAWLMGMTFIMTWSLTHMGDDSE